MTLGRFCICPDNNTAYTRLAWDARRYFEQNQPLLADILGEQTTASLRKFVAEFQFEEALALLDGTQ